MKGSSVVDRADLVVVGGGIVGLASAFRMLEQYPGRRVVVVEKEAEVGLHQTSHNSGVLHSGIYYKPGSLRALNCRDGRAAMVEFCRRWDIPHEVCGKVIVATREEERPGLRTIYERGVENGVRCELIGPERLAELEPHVSGVEAIHVPDAGIADFGGVARALVRRIEESGGEVRRGWKVEEIVEGRGGVRVTGPAGEIEAEQLVSCAGLHSDRVAKMSGARLEAKIVPFRGEYYTLTAEAEHLCRNLIYPVPNPDFPFLGVHFTRMVTGGVECGPNAVLALSREGYRWSNVDPRDLLESLGYAGFRRLVGRHWRAAAGEVWRSLSKAAFVRALQRLVPEIEERHLEPAPAGVRAQAVDRDGRLIDDFLFVESDRCVHVCNAPSPAATASLNIGALVVRKLAKRFGAEGRVDAHF